MATREAFIKQLEEEEDDETTRLVFSDWLEERGEIKESERHRSWKAAKQWFQSLCEKHSSDKYVLSVSSFIGIGNLCSTSNTHSIYFVAKIRDLDKLCTLLNSCTDSFWKNWEVITGKTHEGDRGKPKFFEGV